MYLIFLDIDGVLNRGFDPSRVTRVDVGGLFAGGSRSNTNAGFDYHVESCVAALNTLIATTRAKIVISSSWRTEHPYEELCGILHERFEVVGEIIGQTPDVIEFPACRAAEIRAFLDQFEPDVEGLVILDDQDIFLDINNERHQDPELEARFVRTVTKVGLTTELAQNAARLLLGGSGQSSASTCALS